MVKNPPAMWETWVQPLGWEEPLEEDVATHSSILAWRIPMAREAWRATVRGGHKESDRTERLSREAQKGGAVTNHAAGSILILCDSQCTSMCTFVVNTQEWSFWL